MPFKAGQSGNPKGRPTIAYKARKIREQILKAAPEIVSGLILQAQSGDASAGRTLLATVCPPLKPVECPVVLPFPENASLTDQGRAILTALGQGLLAPGQASLILQALSGLARLIETVELEARITRLEAQK